MQVIAEQTGESMSSLKDRMSEGEISFEMVAEAMKVATSEGGRFYQGMEKQSQTMSGLFSNLKDNSQSLIGEVFLPVSDTIKNTLLPGALGYVDQLQQAFKSDGITGVVAEFGNIAGEIVSSLANSLPQLVNLGVDIIQSLITGIKNNLPTIVTGALDIVNALIYGIIEILPMLLEIGLQALITLGQGIAEALPTLIPTIVNLVISLCDMIIENLPLIITTAIEIILALIQGIITALPTLIAEVPRIINSFSDTIYNALPQILKAGIDILMMLIKGLIESIPVLVANLPQIIMAIINAFTMVNWWNIGKDLIVNIGKGIWGMVKNIGQTAINLGKSVLEGIKGIFTGGTGAGTGLISNLINGVLSLRERALSSIREVGSNMLNGIKNMLSMDSLVNVGRNLIQGLWNGISNMGGWIMDKIGGFASNIIDGVKGFFGIHSPSKVFENEVGVYLAQGLGVGFDKEIDNVNKDIETSLQYDYNASINPNINPKEKEDNVLGAIYGLLKTIADNGISLDGREVARGLAPYQDEFNEYNTRFV